MDAPRLYVVNRRGGHEAVLFDRITERNTALCGRAPYCAR
jgi:hypothetical protein